MKRNKSKWSHIDDDVIIASYKETGSVWKSEEQIGVPGQVIQYRLKRIGIERSNNPFTEEDMGRLSIIYEDYVSSGRIDELAKMFGRTKQFICRMGGKVGKTKMDRPSTELSKQKMSDSQKNKIAKDGHPRGMLGKKHSAEMKAAMAISSSNVWAGFSEDKKSEIVAKSMKTKLEKYGTLATNREGCSWKAAWREIGGKRKYFRSRWEANYAYYLEFLKSKGEIKEWEHEPETFWFEKIKRGVRSYLPDFRVTANDGSVTYHEVKGWMDDRSKTKIKRMKIYHPKVVLLVFDGAWFKKNTKNLKAIVPGWEE